MFYLSNYLILNTCLIIIFNQSQDKLKKEKIQKLKDQKHFEAEADRLQEEALVATDPEESRRLNFESIKCRQTLKKTKERLASLKGLIEKAQGKTCSI